MKIMSSRIGPIVVGCVAAITFASPANAQFFPGWGSPSQQGGGWGRCRGYSGPGGPCYDGPGGPLYSGPGGDCYAGPGGPCYAGPGGDGRGCRPDCP